jgi:WD40 repeat protein
LLQSPKMPVISSDPREFLNEYGFPLKPPRDFELDGELAEFASGHPTEWGSWNVAIDYSNEVEGDSKLLPTSYYSALSSDGKLLAISSSQERISIYDTSSKELRSILEGSGKIVFRPNQRPEKPGYTLLGSISHNGVSENRLILWDLDQHGRLLDEEEPIDTAAFATKAMAAILPELLTEHEWTEEFVHTSRLHAEFEKALSRVAADHRRKHHTVIDNAQLGDFGSVPFSNDGRLLLYHSSIELTQHGNDKLLNVVIYDIDAGKELHSLSGHTNAIMWSAISPDHERIATFARDGTLRMYSVSTGELEWYTGRSERQSWAAAFAHDSKHIIWSSDGGRLIQVFAVSDGHKVSTFQEELSDACRNFAWHPADQQVAFLVGKHAYVWRPFDGHDGTITQHFLLDDNNDENRMVVIQSVMWMEAGKLLSFELSEGTKFVYDTQTNTKEVFMPPKDTKYSSVDQGFYGVLRNDDQPDFYLSVDGDGKVRYWRPSVPAFPWWVKDIAQAAPVPRKVFPETGKYVKVTKVPSKGARRNYASMSCWVEKGAELWTAE